MQTHEAKAEQEARNLVSQEYAAARLSSNPAPVITQDQVWDGIMTRSSRHHLPDSKREAIWEAAMDAAEDQITIEQEIES